ncbi:hypothetical protein [Isoptericola aurantiacus]|uniref:hypothetical protein n=1 Tax=Isoptericola aurantiacus TaxID=3377839 RepID=UPI00383B7897
MSTSDIDRRLARIAPAAPPDPARLTAAHAELTRLTRHEATTAITDPREAHEGDDVGPDEPHDRFSVVVPLPGPRRRRRPVLVAAAAGLVVVAASVVLPGTRDDRPVPVEQPDTGAAAVEACRTRIDEAWPEDSGAAYTTSAVEVRGDVVLVFLAVGDDPDRVALCDVDLTGRDIPGLIGMSDIARLPVRDDMIDHVGSGGGGTRGYLTDWGYVGDDVVGVEVTADGGTTAAAQVVDGYWVASWSPQDDDDKVSEVTWRLSDGTTRTERADDLGEPASDGRRDRADRG